MGGPNLGRKHPAEAKRRAEPPWYLFLISRDLGNAVGNKDPILGLFMAWQHCLQCYEACIQTLRAEIKKLETCLQAWSLPPVNRHIVPLPLKDTFAQPVFAEHPLWVNHRASCRNKSWVRPCQKLTGVMENKCDSDT